MTLTIEEIKERLKRWDEVALLEELEIDSEQIVERFEDVIEDNADRLEQQVNWE